MVLIEIGEEEIWLMNSGIDLIAKRWKILFKEYKTEAYGIPLQLNSIKRDISVPFL